MPFFYPQLLQNINRKKQMFFYSKKMFFNTTEEKAKRHNAIENTSDSTSDKEV
jgi:hypothetical protein